MLDVVSFDTMTQTNLLALSKKFNVIIGGSYLTFYSKKALNTFQSGFSFVTKNPTNLKTYDLLQT